MRPMRVLLSRGDHGGRFPWRRPIALLATRMVVAVLVAWAVVRLCGIDGHSLWTLIAGLSPLLSLPAYPALVVAAWLRRWLLAGLAGLVVVLHIAWLLPSLPPADDVP